MIKMLFYKFKCEFWYIYRFIVCILEYCIFIYYFRLIFYLLFIGVVFVLIIIYYGGFIMFLWFCGIVYSVNNFEFRFWVLFNIGGEM